MALKRSRKPRPRRGSRTEPSLAKKIGLGLIGGLVICVIGGLLGYNALYLNRPEIDQRTGCLKSAPPARLVVLIDQTDTFNAVQRQDIRNQLKESIGNVPRYGEVVVYTISQDFQELPDPAIRACNPGSEKDADPLVEGQVRVKKKWETLFDQPLDDALSKALTSSEANASPILETIQAVSVREFGDPDLDNSSKWLVVVSDFLQHTSKISHYGSNFPEVKDFIGSDQFRRLRADLRDVQIEAMYVQRTTKTGNQGPKHINFWRTLFAEQNGQIMRWVNIDG